MNRTDVSYNFLAISKYLELQAGPAGDDIGNGIEFAFRTKDTGGTYRTRHWQIYPKTGNRPNNRNRYRRWTDYNFLVIINQL